MFSLGRDLRRLFASAREGGDQTWTELIGADLLEAEARAQCDDACRPRGRRPFRHALNGAALWREHARRTGRRASLARALSAANDVGARASGDERIEASLEAALCLMLDHDLRGADRLSDIEAVLNHELKGVRPSLAARMTAAHARLAALKARRDEDPRAMMDAAALLDAALHGVSRRAELSADAAEIRLERAALGLEAGLRRRDARLLDQAGRDLRAVVELAPAEYRPITRARALTLSASGLSALAALAGDETARRHARQMFEAAADAFTPDHSPLDWVGIVMARAAGDAAPCLDDAVQAEALSGGEGLILGALARDHRLATETLQAESRLDATQLSRMETRLRRRLAGAGEPAPLDWAVDQMAVARIHMARGRLAGMSETSHLGLMLVEAAACARENGAGLIAERADALLERAKERASGRA